MSVKDRCTYRGVCPYGCNKTTGCFVENKKVRQREKAAKLKASKAYHADAEKKRAAEEARIIDDLQPFLAEGVIVGITLMNEGGCILRHPNGARFQFTAVGDDATYLSMGLET